MGRWSHLDSDDERLPPGMTRVGYDAATQIYTYRDTDGSYWEGAPGCQYGRLYRVCSGTAVSAPASQTYADDEAKPAASKPTKPKRSGTFARFTRWLSSTLSSSGSRLSRRATVATGQRGQAQAQSSVLTWSGEAPAPGAAGNARQRRATTFDEILGVAGTR